jgi:hypothetical protein
VTRCWGQSCAGSLNLIFIKDDDKLVFYSKFSYGIIYDRNSVGSLFNDCNLIEICGVWLKMYLRDIYDRVVSVLIIMICI